MAYIIEVERDDGTTFYARERHTGRLFVALEELAAHAFVDLWYAGVRGYAAATIHRVGTCSPIEKALLLAKINALADTARARIRDAAGVRM